MKTFLSIILFLFNAFGVIGQIGGEAKIGNVKSLEVSWFPVGRNNCEKTEGDTDIKALILFDIKGNIIQRLTHYFETANETKEIYKYDLSNKLIEEIGFQKNGGLHYENRYRYDNMGNNIETKEYNPDSTSLLDSVVTKYKMGIASRFYYNVKYKSLDGVDTELLDMNKNVIERINYSDQNRLEYKVRYKYDSDNNVIEQYRDSIRKGEVDQKWVMAYDKYGNQISIGFCYKNGNIVYNTFKYDYDNKGNWVKAFEFDRGKLTLICIRKIEYYYLCHQCNSQYS